MGLSINMKKTGSMVIRKSKIQPRCNPNVEGNSIKQVEKFNYLGSMITDNGKCDAGIRRRIGTAKGTFHKMQSKLKDRKMSMTTKIRNLQCYIYPVLSYGCECWTISKPMVDRVKAAEMWFLRRRMIISWTEHTNNKEVLRMELLGHVMRRAG